MNIVEGAKYKYSDLFTQFSLCKKYSLRCINSSYLIIDTTKSGSFHNHIMRHSLLVIALTAEAIFAYPFVAEMDGVDASMLEGYRNAKNRRQTPGGGQNGGAASCPFNKNHVAAPGITAKYPYNGAKNGLPGNGQGGYKVPADGDTAHYFSAPGANDIRGPCPGLNTAANHNFLSHDGVTTFNELVDAQQNLYNVGYDLAVLLAVLGLTTTDGDIVTEKLSIGCDATTRTSFSPTLTGSEPGLDGHNKFEADSSLTRNDFFTANGDNFSFNGTLFKNMDTTCKSNFGRDEMSLYRKQRYDDSKANNPNFYFGPFSLLLFGASSFLYELMPSGTHNYVPDLASISSFFGAKKNDDGSYSFNDMEKIPDNWTNRVKPYDNMAVTSEILAQYAQYPVLFGGNTGNGGFDALNFGSSIKDGRLIAPNPATVLCLLYQLTTERIPSSLNGFVTPTVKSIAYAATKLNPLFQNLGCPLALT